MRATHRAFDAKPWIVGAGLVLLGVAVRCAGWRSVFAPGGIQLIPADTHYYIRFALRQFGHFPLFHQFDPYVNSPTGAEIYWPPLHTWIVAGFIRLFGMDRPELGAACVDPIIAGVELGILGLCAWRLFGRVTASLVMGLYALLPAAVFSAQLGCADHHVHEPFFVALTCLLLGRAIEVRSTRLATATGVVLGLSRLFTPVSPLLLVPAALTLAVRNLTPRPPSRGGKGETQDASFRSKGPEEKHSTTVLDSPFPSREGGRGVRFLGLSCAIVLMLGVLAFGDPRSFEYEPLSLFHPLFALVLFLPVAGWAQWRSRIPRWWILPAIAIAAAVPLVPELLRAADHFGRVDPILSEVSESQPMSLGLAFSFFSAGLIAVPLAVLGAWRRLKRGIPDALPALVASAVLLPAALEQIRFVQALSGALVVLIAMGLPAAFVGLKREAWLRQATYALGALVFAGSLAPAPPDEWDTEVRLIEPSLQWMRDHTPRASDPMSDQKPAYGVVSSPLLGHLIALWAERPAVATTFSQAPVHTAGIERANRVLSAMTGDEAYAAMRDTGARYLVLTPWLRPFGHPEVDATRTFVTRLYDGNTSDARFRLIHDSPAQRLDGHGSEVRIFEVE